MLLSNAHAHTNFVDGKNTARDLLEAALQKGFVSFGFSEHAIQPNSPQYGLTPEKEARYIAEVRALAAEYAGRIRVWLGTERDALSPADRTKYDYVIGSVHYLPGGNDEEAIVDGPADELAEVIKTRFHGDGLAYAVEYYDTLSSYIESYKPDIIGHFDLLRKNNPKLRFVDTDSPAYRKLALDALERMIATNALLEVNTGAMARGYLADPYPEEWILAHWRKLGGRTIISTDTHHVDTIDYGWQSAVERCREAGYESVWTLGTGDILFTETSL